ncbi:linear amide C-N hydrolase [Undibacterium sp. SXout11W]|uniref:linear amide C-N hydrolase n=1 Tax=Undibacterium sp. SXout11W TaxID=3413050 RepID=UPI003BF38993
MCTRVYNNHSQFLSTSRNFDWPAQLPTSLFAFDKGLDKQGTKDVTKNTLKWHSKFSSVVAMIGTDSDENAGEQNVGYGVCDGVNSAGLMVNVLWEGEASLPNEEALPYWIDLKRLGQYLLDMYESVIEATAFLEKNQLRIIQSIVPGSDKQARPHLSLSDSKGNSAIVEFRNQRVVCYVSSNYRIMTNEPDLPTQLNLTQAWEWQDKHFSNLDKSALLGGPSSVAHFQRATYYLAHVRAAVSMQESLAQSKGIASICAVPAGNMKADGSLGSHTVWQTIADHNSATYYFSNTRAPGVVWLPLQEMIAEHKFKKHTSWKLEMIAPDPSLEDGVYNPCYSGDVSALLKKTYDPFQLI